MTIPSGERIHGTIRPQLPSNDGLRSNTSQYIGVCKWNWKSLWASGQRSWVPFLVQPDYLRSSRPGMGSTHPHEDNWGARWMKNSSFGLESEIISHVDPLPWPCNIPYPQNLALTSPTSGCSSIDIVHLRTKSQGVYTSEITCQIAHGHPGISKGLAISVSALSINCFHLMPLPFSDFVNVAKSTSCRTWRPRLLPIWCILRSQLYFYVVLTMTLTRTAVKLIPIPVSTEMQFHCQCWSYLMTDSQSICFRFYGVSPLTRGRVCRFLGQRL
jgi:hypothetical protein